LWRSLVPLDHYPAGHHSRLEVAPNQPQHPLVLDPLGQPPHQHIVIDAIEESLQIHVNDAAASFLDIPLRFRNYLLGAAARAETVAVLRKRRIESRLQDLKHRLLDEPVEHGRNPESTIAAASFRNLLPLHRLWSVRPHQ